MNHSAIDFDRYRKIFFPLLFDERKRILGTGIRFAYYTTAETAAQILKNREIWLRSTSIMNDHSEIQYGLSKVIGAFSTNEGKELEAALEKTIAGSTDAIKKLFNTWAPLISADTFIASLSEHPPEEDQYGRLSMWRAYGGDAGVAIVLNPEVFFNEINPLPVYTSPVAYLDASGIVAAFSRVTNGIHSNKTYVRGLGLQGLTQAIFNALRFAIICTKHPAFKEEREWRVIASPSLESHEHLQQSVEFIGGIPQTILKKRIEDQPEKGIVGLHLNDFIERILIGPCEFPEIITRAIASLLEDAGVEKPYERIHVTGIPLRPNQR
jgi:hypothetical protein